MDQQQTDVDGQSTTVYMVNAALDGARVEPTGNVDLQSLFQPRLQRVDQDIATKTRRPPAAPARAPQNGTPAPTQCRSRSSSRALGAVVCGRLPDLDVAQQLRLLSRPSVIINNPPTRPIGPATRRTTHRRRLRARSTPNTVASSQAASRSTALEAARSAVSGQSSGTGGGVAATNKSAAAASVAVGAATAKAASVASDVSTSSVGKSASSVAGSSGSSTASRSAGSTSAGTRGSAGISSSSSRSSVSSSSSSSRSSTGGFRQQQRWQGHQRRVEQLTGCGRQPPILTAEAGSSAAANTRRRPGTRSIRWSWRRSGGWRDWRFGLGDAARASRRRSAPLRCDPGRARTPDSGGARCALTERSGEMTGWRR